MSDSSDNYLGVLLEEIRDQNKVVLEAVSEMQLKVSNLPAREEFTDLKQDVKIIKAAITDMSNQQKNHERRISRLESI